MGVVHLARPPGRPRVALKVLRPAHRRGRRGPATGWPARSARCSGSAAAGSPRSSTPTRGGRSLRRHPLRARPLAARPVQEEGPIDGRRPDLVRPLPRRGRRQRARGRRAAPRREAVQRADGGPHADPHRLRPGPGRRRPAPDPHRLAARHARLPRARDPARRGRRPPPPTCTPGRRPSRSPAPAARRSAAARRWRSWTGSAAASTTSTGSRRGCAEVVAAALDPDPRRRPTLPTLLGAGSTTAGADRRGPPTPVPYDRVHAGRWRSPPAARRPEPTPLRRAARRRPHGQAPVPELRPATRLLTDAWDGRQPYDPRLAAGAEGPAGREGPPPVAARRRAASRPGRRLTAFPWHRARRAAPALLAAALAPRSRPPRPVDRRRLRGGQVVRPRALPASALRGTSSARSPAPWCWRCGASASPWPRRCSATPSAARHARPRSSATGLALRGLALARPGRLPRALAAARVVNPLRRRRRLAGSRRSRSWHGRAAFLALPRAVGADLDARGPAHRSWSSFHRAPDRRAQCAPVLGHPGRRRPTLRPAGDRRGSERGGWGSSTCRPIASSAARLGRDREPVAGSGAARAAPGPGGARLRRAHAAALIRDHDLASGGRGRRRCAATSASRRRRTSRR